MNIIIIPKGEKAQVAARDFLLMKDLNFFEKRLMKVFFEIKNELPSRIVLIGKKFELERIDSSKFSSVINNSFYAKGVKEKDLIVKVE